MTKRINIFFILLLLIVALFTSPVSIVANVNVKDCIETDDCDEENERADQMEREDTIDDPPFKQSSLTVNIIKMVVALLFVLGLIYLFLHLLKRRNRLYERSSVLENLGGISVGQQKSVQMIRIGSKVFVLGIGEDINVLTEIEEMEVKEQILSEREHGNEPLSFFKGIINQSKRKNDNQVGTYTEEEQFQRTLQQELAKLRESRNSIVDRYLDNEKDDDKHV